MKRALSIALLLLTTVPSWGIGRSGNGRVVDELTGFAASLPASFLEFEQFGRALKASERRVSSSGFNFSPAFVEFRDLAGEFPELRGRSRAETASHFAKVGWQKLDSRNCIDFYASRSDSAATRVAVWGRGKGVVALGPNTQRAEEALSAVSSSLTLKDGACAWN